MSSDDIRAADAVPIRLYVCVRRIAFGEGVGGMERAAADHAGAMADSGIEVTVFTPRATVHGAVPSNLRIVNVAWPAWLGPRTPVALSYPLWLRRLGKAIELERRPDALHLHGGAAGLLKPRWVRRAGGISSVVNPHGMEEFEKSSPLKTMGRIILRRLSRRAANATVVIATDHILRLPLIEKLKVSEDRVVVIPNSVDIGRLLSFSRPSEGHEGFQIVTIGRLVPNKGYDILVAALRDADLQAALPTPWAWTHYGSGSQLRALTDAAARSPAVALTVLEGRSDAEVQGALSTADLFIQPSRYEGSSLTTLEAMAQGVVVVATAVGGMPDKIVDGRTGYLADPNPEELAKAMLRALTGADTRAAARQRLQDEFSSERAAERYLDLYTSLVQPGVG